MNLLFKNIFSKANNLIRFQVNAKLFLASIVIGFLSSVACGVYVSHLDTLKGVVRLNHLIHPMNQFYPTASMLRNKALDGLTPDQTLILIGGNSNFNGQGQNESELWSLRLQEILGPKYRVVNLATMGSTSADLAGVVFRMVEPIHSKTLFVFNIYANSIATYDGLYNTDVKAAPFTYVLWDAYYKNLLASASSETKQELAIIKEIEIEHGEKEFNELHLRSFIDSLVYAQDLWVNIDYNFLNAVWTQNRYYSPWTARKNLKEQYVHYPDLKVRLARSGMSEELLLNNVRGHFDGLVAMDPTGVLKPNEDQWNNLKKSYAALFPNEQKKKIIIAILWPGTLFVKKLTNNEREKLSYVEKRAEEELAALDYIAIGIGQDFDDEDFETSFHYVASGGNKIATVLANKIQSVDQKSR